MSEPSEPASARRAEVAAIALRLFVERGYAGTSIAAVAREAGVSKAALYHHFASKEAMFVGALTADVDAPIARIEALALDREAPAAGRLHAALGAAHDAMMTGALARLIPVLAQVAADFPDVAHGFHESVVARLRRAMRMIYADAVDAGTHRALLPRDVDQLVFGPLIGNAMTMMLMAGAGDIGRENLDGTYRDGFIAMIDRITACWCHFFASATDSAGQPVEQEH